ncbi:MAG TPA: farnesyl diphosphate synthase [Hyphomicrobiaceae bacterium]|nr:farnesyl diphosphate synthase [Hyphomicrobiaceae bacterium]
MLPSQTIMPSVVHTASHDPELTLNDDRQTFEARLAEHVASVERALDAILKQEPETPLRLREAMAHAVLGGGKRFRPFLVIESAAMFGVPAEHAIPAAAALECVHCYSLVHDDLPAMDNDTLRRGQPTVWAKFDEWTAILAGDALLTLAFEVMARPQSHPEADVRARLCGLLAQAGGRRGMVGGQCLDLEADKLGFPPAPDAAHIRRLQSMKTGALIQFACEAGAILGNAEPMAQSALRTYGGQLGFAFQIADDLLDLEGSPETVGKATGKDAEAGKATLAAKLGIKAAREELTRAHTAAHEALAQFGDKAMFLRAAADFAVSRTH